MSYNYASILTWKGSYIKLENFIFFTCYIVKNLI